MFSHFRFLDLETKMASKRDTSQVLNERLKCKICETGPRAGKSHWYQCYDRHDICQDCLEVAKNKNCSCGKPISKVFCATTEELLKLDLMRFKCINTSRGCKEIFGEKAMISHEEDCIYRLVPCPNDRCQVKVPFHELLDHMKEKEKHFTDSLVNEGGKFIDYSSLKGSTRGFSFIPEKIEFDDRVFFLGGIRFEGKETLHFWIQLYGSKYEAKNYYYTLEFHGIDPNIKDVYTRQAISVDETSDEIMKTNKCFGIKFDIFKAQFMDENCNYKISISIRNMKEEVKDDNEESGVSDNDD